MSQDDLAQELTSISDRQISRDRIQRWERGFQVPNDHSRHWLAVVLRLPKQLLDDAALTAHSQARIGTAAVVAHESDELTPRSLQGTPALLPVLRSRVQAGILAATLLAPHRAFSLSELAVHAGASLSSVAKESAILEQAGLVVIRRSGTVKIIRAAPHHFLIGSLSDLLRHSYGIPQILGEELGRISHVARITVTGLWAQRFAGEFCSGTDSINVALAIRNSESLDTDELNAAIRRAEQRTGHSIHYTIDAPLEQHSAKPGHRGSTTAVEVAVITPPPDVAPVIAPKTEGARSVRPLINERQLQLAGGTEASSGPYLELASQHLDAAEQLLPTSPTSSLRLIAEANELIARALLARQGIVPGPHAKPLASAQTVTAQFGSEFAPIEEIAKVAQNFRDATTTAPHHSADDATNWLTTVRDLKHRAHRTIPSLALFS